MFKTFVSLLSGHASYLLRRKIQTAETYQVITNATKDNGNVSCIQWENNSPSCLHLLSCCPK